MNQSKCHLPSHSAQQGLVWYNCLVWYIWVPITNDGSTASIVDWSSVFLAEPSRKVPCMRKLWHEIFLHGNFMFMHENMKFPCMKMIFTKNIFGQIFNFMHKNENFVQDFYAKIFHA